MDQVWVQLPQFHFYITVLSRLFTCSHTHTHVILSVCSVIWYWPKGGNAVWLGRYPRAFSVAGPMVRNSLPDHLQDPMLGSDCAQSRLKTRLFSLY